VTGDVICIQPGSGWLIFFVGAFIGAALGLLTRVGVQR
jgi:hypothetical protein